MAKKSSSKNDANGPLTIPRIDDPPSGKVNIRAINDRTITDNVPADYQAPVAGAPMGGMRFDAKRNTAVEPLRPETGVWPQMKKGI